MSARDAIFNRLRQSLRVSGEDPARKAAVASRLREAPKGVIPARGQLPPRERTELFCAEAEKVQATIARVDGDGAVPGAVADFLKSRNLPPALRMGDDSRLTGMPWDSEPNLDIARGVAKPQDEVGLAYANAGIAETGTLVLQSGSANPTTNNFLPNTHIVVVDGRDIECDLEAVWARLRAQRGKGAMPRTVNLITGPSRSGDIEQTLLLGAHGPRNLHVIVVG